MITKEKGKYVIRSKETRKKLGSYDTKEEALKRLRQIEYFKNRGKK